MVSWSFLLLFEVDSDGYELLKEKKRIFQQKEGTLGKIKFLFLSVYYESRRTYIVS